MRFAKLSLVLLFFTGLGASAYAAEVLQVSANGKIIAVSNEDGHTWKPKDGVCVYQTGQEAGCGTVVKLLKQGAIVRLSPNSKAVAKGDSAAYVTALPRKLASTGEISGSASAGKNKLYTWDVTAGLSLGTNYFYPMGFFQRRISNNLTLGLQAFFVSSSSGASSVSVIGGLLTLNYYLKSAYRGLWLQAGGGITMFSINDGVSAATSQMNPSGLATVGYRGIWDLGLNVGVAAGLLYITPVVSNTITVSFAGPLPILMLDAGINF